ncbi:MAG: hypothetical protein FJZ00_11315 [Candidatus Sericytochromatia bacterium]|uniref:Uncharacterized protein n=1 Tax=Candidatus Tanganyikabacteria bacterium TaxID=2961651 RepID=A0A938BP22_9BACT|nr:hypothetical protein [Candidatus Tanganyikabacteria bacterium]
MNGGITATNAAGIAVPIGIAVSTSAIPLGLGAYDAFLEAQRQNAEPRFKIDYGESL